MKKVLYSTTALAAAAMLAFSGSAVEAAAKKKAKAKPLKVSVGGFMTSLIGFSENDGAFEVAATTETNGNVARVNYDNFNIINDSEITFKGSTKLDNGITVSLQVGLEADQVNGSDIDESYMKFTGGFGDVRIGSIAFGGATLAHQAPENGPLQMDTPHTDSWIIKPANITLSNTPAGTSASGTNIGGNDSIKLVYISPKFANAVYVGASYAPSLTNNDFMPAVGGTAGTENQMFDVTVSYESKVGGAAVKADISYAELHGNAASSFKFIRGGLNVGIGGLTLGFGYKDQEDMDTGKAGTANSDEEEVYDVGIGYAAGAYKVSVGHFHAERPLASTTTGDDEVDKYGLGATYNIGPGVDVKGGLYHVEYNDEGTADADNNDGWAAVAGVTVKF